MIIKGERSSCNRLAFKARYFDGMDIYDRERNWYKIHTARLVECSFWEKFAFLFLGRKLAVDLDIQFQGRASQVEIVKAVADSLRKDEEFWSAGEDVDDLIDKVRATRDVHGILSALDWFRTY